MSEKEAETKGDDGGAALTVVLRAGLHCEGCAHKLKRSIKKHFHGVESVKTNYATGKVTVVGKVDPAKVKERVEAKTKKTAQLVSPKPPKKAKDGGDQKSDDKPPEKKPDGHGDHKAAEEKPREVAATTVVLKTRVHCDNCARKINKIINKCEGVEDVNVDMEKDKVTVKGIMDMEAMLPYLNTKLKRAVEIAPPPQKDNDGSNKKPESGNEKGELPNRGDDGDNEDVVKPAADEGGRKPPVEEEKESRVEVVNKMEHKGTKADEYGAHTYDPQEGQAKGYAVEYWTGPGSYYMNGSSYDTNAPPPYYLHAPEMFSDDNPNACSVM